MQNTKNTNMLLGKQFKSSSQSSHSFTDYGSWQQSSKAHGQGHFIFIRCGSFKPTSEQVPLSPSLMSQARLIINVCVSVHVYVCRCRPHTTKVRLAPGWLQYIIPRYFLKNNVRVWWQFSRRARTDSPVFVLWSSKWELSFSILAACWYLFS